MKKHRQMKEDSKDGMSGILPVAFTLENQGHCLKNYVFFK